MIVTGASSGPIDGESPIGISNRFTSACAIPKKSRTKTQISIFFIIFDQRGETVSRLPSFLHRFLFERTDYILPIAFTHLGYLFLARSRGTLPVSMICRVPGLARVER